MTNTDVTSEAAKRAAHAPTEAERQQFMRLAMQMVAAARPLVQLFGSDRRGLDDMAAAFRFLALAAKAGGDDEAAGLRLAAMTWRHGVSAGRMEAAAARRLSAPVLTLVSSRPVPPPAA